MHPIPRNRSFSSVDIVVPLDPDTPLLSSRSNKNKRVNNDLTKSFPTNAMYRRMSVQADDQTETLKEVVEGVYAVLDAAVQLTESIRRNFSDQEQDVVKHVEDYVNGKGNTMFEDLSTSEDLGVDGEYEGDVNEPSGRLARIKRLLQFIANNEAQSTEGRYACNLANATVRFVVSVFIPTLLRQQMAYLIEQQLQSLPEEYQYTTRVTIAFIAGAYPVILNIAGTFADYRNGTATPMSNVCRALNIVWGMGGLCAAYYLGKLPGLAASLVAYNAYCFLRDGAQLCLQLEDTKHCKLGPIVASGTLYAVNQFVVNSIMRYGGSPSGQAAAGLPYVNVVGNDLHRSTYNLGGEIVDYFTYVGTQCFNSGEEVRVKLRPQKPTAQSTGKMMIGIHAGRTFLFTQAVLLDAILSTVTSMIESPEAQNTVSDAIIAGILGLFYSVLVGTATGGESCTIL